MIKPKVFVNTKTGEMKTQIPVLEIGDYREATEEETKRHTILVEFCTQTQDDILIEHLREVLRKHLTK